MQEYFVCTTDCILPLGGETILPVSCSEIAGDDVLMAQAVKLFSREVVVPSFLANFSSVNALLAAVNTSTYAVLFALGTTIASVSSDY